MKVTHLDSLSVVKMMTLLQLFVSLVSCSQFVLASNASTSHVSDGKRIGVIGAGAGGSSLSYYLQKYTGHRYNITVFEANGYIGGRSTTVGNYARSLGSNVTDKTLLNSDLELGGSVFITANYIMTNAVEMFNLSMAGDTGMDEHPELFDGSTGVWDGSKMLFWVQGTSVFASLINNVKSIVRYNISLLYVVTDLQKIMTSFLTTFYMSSFPFDMETVVSEAGLTEYTDTIARDYLTEKSYGKDFMNEIAEGATRVNYRSALDDIHTMGAFISMAAATGGTGSVEGGNYQVFENFLEWSEADVLLNTRVSKLVKNDDGTWDAHYTEEGDDDNEIVQTFDQVVIAAPFQFTEIDVVGANVSLQSVEYRKLYASYVQTSGEHLVDHKQYGKKVGIDTLLTSGEEDDVPYFSINVVGYDNETDTATYKVFTEGGIDESFLTEQMFANASGTTVWFQKEWYPYPRLQATGEFDGFDVAEGLWYLNGMERFVSTMETSCLAGASVAGHIAKGYNTTVIAVP